MAKVLIIEDDESTQKFLKVILEKEDHEILCAFDGATAIEKTRGEQPDIILSDLMLPTPPSDVQLLKKLRELAPDSPIVVISGYPSQDRIKECEELGVKDFLTKPFEVPFVREIVERLVKND